MHSYYNLYDDLKTGDLVFFSGNSVASKIIKYFSGCDYSHVGMIIKVDVIGKNVLALFESDFDNTIKDHRNGVRKTGVKLINLTSKLNVYNGTFSVRPLNKELGDNQIEDVNEIIKNLSTSSYQKNLYSFVKAIFKIKSKKKGDSSIFCSELMVIILKKIGLLDKDVNPEWFTPCDVLEIDNMNVGYYYKELLPLYVHSNK